MNADKFALALIAIGGFFFLAAIVCTFRACYRYYRDNRPVRMATPVADTPRHDSRSSIVQFNQIIGKR